MNGRILKLYRINYYNKQICLHNFICFCIRLRPIVSEHFFSLVNVKIALTPVLQVFLQMCYPFL